MTDTHEYKITETKGGDCKILEWRSTPGYVTKTRKHKIEKQKIHLH